MATPREGSAEAAQAAGWKGIVVRTFIASWDVDALVEVNEREHSRRTLRGLRPARDPVLFYCLMHSGALGEDAPVRVSGLLVHARSWKSGARIACGLSAFAAQTVVLREEPAAESLVDADISGIGVAVTGVGGTQLLVPPSAPASLAMTAMHRLVAEDLYAAAYPEIVSLAVSG